MAGVSMDHRWGKGSGSHRVAQYLGKLGLLVLRKQLLELSGCLVQETAGVM